MTMTSQFHDPLSVLPPALPPSNSSSSAKSGKITTTGGFGGAPSAYSESSTSSAATRPVTNTTKFGGPLRSEYSQGSTGFGSPVICTTGFSSPLIPRATYTTGLGAAKGPGGSVFPRTNPSESRFSGSYSSGSPGSRQPSGTQGFKPTEIVNLSSPPRSATNVAATICEARIVDIPKPEAPTMPPGSPNPGQLGVLRISSL
ncbi:cuticle collagen 13-like [Hyalella azteca]|uniref:Cuticle collagen 13-like n=1 Tax=Hyalella azteca TaxID=294128 RepID=A0A979FS10_HYAAZ|nr:cuticle collagen 13-like [Hyalella azteca]